MKKYDNYKDSGIEWIGEIPEHWNVQKLKYLFNIIPSNVDKKAKENESEVLLCNYVDVYKNDKITFDLDFMNATASDSQINKLTLQKFDVIATKDSEDPNDIGVPALVLENMKGVVCGYHLTLFRSKESDVLGNYLFWFLKSKMCSQYFSTLARGITRYALGTSSFSNLPLFSINDTDEIKSIANYLNHKTTQIDILISKKQQFISLLQEERIAVINQAVTKGLDPKVKMKDSGIEWLGEIPEHWEVKKLKFLLNENKDALKTGPFGSHIKNSDYIPNGEFKVYTQRNVLDNEYENGCESITEEKFSELKGFSIYEGDILITTRGSIGRCSVFPKGLPLGILHPCLIRIQVNEKLSLKNWVINYINNTSLFYNNVKYNSNSTIIDVIYGYTLKEIFFPVPNINEQREILDFLEIKIGEIEKLISKSQQEIELLKEYKTALISEVVTGKVDVREEIIN